jgi:hypothetical protein
MSDTPEPLKVFGAEIRLRSGQQVKMNEGGTVEVIPSPPKEVIVDPELHHYKMRVAFEKDHSKSLMACSDDYDSLIVFLKQLEQLDYFMLNIERVEGTRTPLN